MKIHIQTFFTFSLLCLTSSYVKAGDANIDFNKTILPILKDSCFACHVPGGDAPYASKDPLLSKKIKKEVADALENLTMGDHFPFADEDSAAKQLKHLEKQLTKYRMPPNAQAELGLGLPLSDTNRKLLLKWITQQMKALNP